MDEESRDFEKDQQELKKNKRKIIKVVFLSLLFSATFYSVFLISKSMSGGELSSLLSLLKNSKTNFLYLFLAVVLLLFFTDILKFCLLSKMTEKRFNLFINFKASVMGKFYDNITPLAVGGQPFLMYYYTKKGYQSGNAMAIPIIKYIIQLFSWIVVSLFLFIFNKNALRFLPSSSATLISVVCYLGLALACIPSATLIFFTLAPNFTQKAVAFVIKILCKLRLCKNFDSRFEKTLQLLDKYRTSLRLVYRKFFGLIALFLLSAADFLLCMSLPFFLLTAFGGVDAHSFLLIDIITLNAYAMFAASLIPTPGNSGAVEAAASLVFAPVAIASGSLFWIVFLWRLSYYYSYIILGIMYFAVKFFKRKKSN